MRIVLVQRGFVQEMLVGGIQRGGGSGLHSKVISIKANEDNDSDTSNDSGADSGTLIQAPPVALTLFQTPPMALTLFQIPPRALR